MSSKKSKGALSRRQRMIQKNIRIAMRECVNGCGRGKAGARYCVDCGTALPIAGGVTKSVPAPTPSAPAFLAKSRASTDALWFGHRDDNDPDPAAREAAWQRQFNGLVIKSQAPVAEDAPLRWDPNSADPAERELAWQQVYTHASKGR
ncbi:hypothetical protein [Streptomyces olivochromogenes]|uniref:Uncharacterized protein n=1 Tax=Streptomyces olivochromogenes TaxID=1963 RepID=A0A250VF95_STROL|nr:hypothetical protein [Streptomyces olivochromogenes]KUN47439.1 hypothetical protein AQJ27_10915 [Streptomyces olivochromogenes]GAX52857.1 hypothetical protein SO3561_04376 [Streptomyces olivochromogenes]